MKKILLLLCLAVCVIACQAKPVTDQPTRCAPEDFLIVSCDNGDYVITDIDEYLRLQYEAGFNTSWFLTEDKMPLVKKHNLKGSLRLSHLIDKSIENPTERAEKWAIEAKKIIDRVGKENIFWFESSDEPTMKDLDKLAALSKEAWKLGVRPYINLNPNYADLNYLGAKSYEEYADAFIKKCNLDYVSYDNYSFDIDEGFQQDRYFSNIESIAKVAKENNVPFYNIILSTAHFNYMQPSDWSIELQGWTTIAYGGKGISYYTFIQPPFGNYKGGAFDNFGNTTPTYNYVREMNLQIHSIASILKDLEHINTFHYPNVPKGCRGLESSKLLKAFETQTKVGIADVVVGEFKGKTDGKDYIIIVNKEAKYPAFICMPQFKNGGTCTDILPCVNPIKWNKNMQEMTFGGENQWLAPGRGMIIRCDK